MIKDALQYLVSLARPELVPIGERQYSTSDLRPVKEPQPAALAVNTLTAFVDFIKNGKDKIVPGSIVLVHDWKSVSLLSPLYGQFQQRDTLIQANAMLPALILGRFLDNTNFQIMLRSAFVAEGDRDTLIKLAGNVMDMEALRSVDDGMSQTVTVQTGVTTKSREKLPDPAVLAPFRTFLEVKQPNSEFIFRMEKGPAFGLWEADGGAWKLEAMKRCKAWLVEALGDNPNVIVLA